MAMAFAARADELSWFVMAAIAAKASPVTAHDRPNAQEPPAGRPTAVRPTADSTPMPTRAIVVTMTAADSPAHAPTTVAPSSSVRPFSSSARACRVTSMIASTPMSTPPIAAIFRRDRAPSDVGSQIRPYIATATGTSLTADAAVTRDASSGYRAMVADAENTVISGKTTIHTGRRMRSRRSAKRVSVQVPTNLPMSRLPIVLEEDLLERWRCRRQ